MSIKILHLNLDRIIPCSMIPIIAMNTTSSRRDRRLMPLILPKGRKEQGGYSHVAHSCSTDIHLPHACRNGRNHEDI